MRCTNCGTRAGPVTAPADGRPPEVVLAALADVLTACAVRTAAALRLADHVAAGHRDLPELATAAGVQLRALTPLVRLLADKGVLRLDAPTGSSSPRSATCCGRTTRAAWRAHLDLDAPPA